MGEYTNMENIEEIASSINKHAQLEIKDGYRNRAFARAYCSVTSTYIHESGDKVFWLVNSQNTRGMQYQRNFVGNNIAIAGQRETLEGDGQPVYKNTKLGEILTKSYQGTHHYTTPTNTRRINDVDITIYNRSVYSPCPGSVEEIEIRMAGDTNYYRFQKLSDLLNTKREDQEDLRRKKEELQKLKEIQEQLIETQRKIKEKEEKARIEEERRKREEEERLRNEEIERLEQSIYETNQKIKSVKSFLRKSVALRSQHLLDPFQDEAKRSHIYDGIPIVIDGGPGTGKTTTVIQRLKFLLDRNALDVQSGGYESPLTPSQIDYLTDPASYNSRWLFFSPTDLLLHYLRNNMNVEGLNATEENTRTLPKFRQKIMRDYCLFDPTKDGPFKNYRPLEGEELLVVEPMTAIAEFEKFCIEYSTKIIAQRIGLQTSQYDWHQTAVRIKNICFRYTGINDVEALMRLFNSLRDNEYSKVREIENVLKSSLQVEAIKVKQAVVQDNEMYFLTQRLFEKWRNERIQSVDEDEELSDEEEEEEMESFTQQEFEAQLFSQIKQLIKQLALKRIDSRIKISRKNQELNELIKKAIEISDVAFDKVGNNAWFVRNFASLCRGVESNLIKNIPLMYKAFRKQMLVAKEKDSIKSENNIADRKFRIYNIELLDKIVKKDANKHLHPDEQNLLVGFINHILYEINKKSKLRFQSLKHKYVNAYVNNVKPVIGIDEATDYTLLDYYFMVSFRHYDFSSITLCGDIMQGLNGNGIRSWEELQQSVLPKLEVKSLNISYRQLPTLLDIAREMYKDELGHEPAYYSDKEKSNDEPKPLLFISNDEEEKARWISNCILDIYRAYDYELPSVAIFVGETVNINDFIARIVDLDMLNGIEVVDCSGNNTLQNKEMIRVFRLSEVKGMEFEAVFFYDIDQAIKGHSLELMRRYLYVGISRATSHLAATMCSIEGGNNIIKYFDTETDRW